MSGKTKGKQSMACCGGQAVRLQNKVRDPLCGAMVATNSPYRMEAGGTVHLFCGESCRDDFARAKRGEVSPGVTFECPMHPETRQNLPGECAVCDMALVPVRRNHSGSDTGEMGAGMLGRLRSVLRI